MLAALVVLGVCSMATAQQPADAQASTAATEAATEAAPPAKYRSPRATMRTFLEAMNAQPPDLDAAARALDLSDVVAEKAPFLANDLYRIINRIERVDLDERTSPIPDTGAMQSSRYQGAQRWVYFPRAEPGLTLGSVQRLQRFAQVQELIGDHQIVLARQPNGAWKFSADTVAAVDDMWAAVRHLDPVGTFVEHQTIADRIESWWPASFTDNGFLGVRYWQWASLLLLILIGVVLDFTVRGVLTVISRRWIARRGGRATSDTLRRTVRPFGLTAAALLWLWGITLLDLPSDALKVLIPAVKLFVMLATVWAGFRVTDLLAEVAASKAAGTANKFDDLLIPLVRKTIKIFIFVFGLIYIAGALNVPLAPLLTGLGIGGAGFAFAAKDTLEHFFGSVTVIADRPFEVGDWVKINDTEGIVEELGFRSTRIRTFYNSQVTVPNGNLVRAVVDNFGRRQYRRWSTHLTVTYGTPPEKIEAFCEGIRELIRNHPYTRKDYYQVWLHQFGAHSLDILLYVFFAVPDWNTELRERHRLCVDILRLADRLGVEFAFPTQTLHVFREDATAEHQPAQPPGTDTELAAQKAGREAFQAITKDAPWRTEQPGPYEFLSAEQTRIDTSGPKEVDERVGGDE